MTAEAARPGDAAPSWMLVLPLLVTAHVCEEWWGGPGFTVWAEATLGADVGPSRFLQINAIGLILITLAVIGAVYTRSLAWLAVAISTLVVVNGTIHLLLSVAFGSYSPGTLTGVFLYFPIGGSALIAMWRSLSRPVFAGGVLAGVGIHALATLSALG